MRIVHVTHSLDPMKGGTSVAVRCLAEGCALLGVASPVISLDPPGAPWLRGWQVPVTGAGPGLMHFGWSSRLKKVLRKHVEGASIVVVHGLWQYHNVAVRSICREIGVPFIVYPHGMMDPWALRQSRFAKRVAWRIIVAPLLRGAAGISFTTESEHSAAAAALHDLPARALILPLGVEGPPDEVTTLRAEFFERQPQLTSRRILLFVGRLHPKKGVDILIEGFARWRSTLGVDEQRRWHLRLTGPPDSDTYQKELEELLDAHGLRLDTDVTMPGMVPGRLRWQEFAAAEAFILPSHQENFGIVVGEAIACGKAALLSDRVNTSPWVVKGGAGLTAPDTVGGVEDLLRNWMSLTHEQQRETGRLARQLFERQFAVPARCQEFVHAVQSIIGGSAGDILPGKLRPDLLDSAPDAP